MKASLAMDAALILALLAILSACGFAGIDEQVRPSADPAVACSSWTEMTDGERVSHADRIVGDSADLLDRVRVRQHQPVGTPRDTLIVDVAQSLTKMCDVWAAPDRPIDEVMDALY